MSEQAGISPLSAARDPGASGGGRSLPVAVIRDALLKLNPFHLIRNPVLFITEVAAAVGTVFQIYAFWTAGLPEAFDFSMAIALWITLLCATTAEAWAEAREKQRADRFRKAQADFLARRLSGGKLEVLAPSKLRAGDVVVVESGELVPVDGEIVDGIATVDESPITGESAPVIRESGANTSAATAGARVLSGTIHVRAARAPGESLLERMVTALENCNDGRTPDELRIHSVLWVAALLAAFFVASLIIACFLTGADVEHDTPALPGFAGFLICLMPIGIAALVRSCGVAGLGRLLQKRVVANAREPVEEARQLTTVLVDKTGTVTIGNRQAIEFIPMPDVRMEELAEAAYLASLSDMTPEGQSTLELAESVLPGGGPKPAGVMVRPVEFSEFTRMSGADMGPRILRKGAVDSVAAFVRENRGVVPPILAEIASQIAKAGGTPLAVAENAKLLGVIHLRDIVKPGIAPQMQILHAMGIRSVLMTGDNPVTASAIAHEAGIDDVFAQATPADKLTYIKREQERGEIIAMAGDGTDDAPSLAQADVGLAMNSGTIAAKEAGCMVALGGNPAAIVEVAAVGRQIWAARTALLTYSLFAGIADCLLLGPVLLKDSFPDLAPYASGALQNADRAILSGVLLQALTVFALLRPAFCGVFYWPRRLRTVIARNAILFGAAGLVVPPIGIWVIYRILTALSIPPA